MSADTRETLEVPLTPLPWVVLIAIASLLMSAFKRLEQPRKRARP
jgi:hypothetical protein